MFTTLREQKHALSNLGNRSLLEIVKEGRLLIDAALAERILKEAKYDGQRDHYAFHEALLVDAMNRKRWTAGSQICFARLGHQLYLVNGQHRMHAVVKVGVPIEFQVLIVDADTMDEVDVLYRRFDVIQRGRSIAEVLNSNRAIAKHGLSKGMAKAVYEAVGLISNGFERPNYQVDPVKARSVDSRLDAAKSWWETAAIYESYIEKASVFLKKKLLTQGVTAVALVTIKYQPATARDFWVGIAENDGLRRGDPRRTLILDLSNRMLRAGVSSHGAAVTQIAWNAFYEVRTLKLIKLYENHVVRIAGTPIGSRG